MTDYIKIFEGNFITVQLIKSRLEEIGINPVIKDENESGRLSGFAGARLPEVFVHKSEEEKARPIIESIQNETEA
ncbi:MULTISPECIES: DUF2007 domain-containing protein [unclassified Olleya]|uniref:putative signal transducing protein n=1 Tax=unclassified Olleya TaxID=2615019 RepID=UPI000C300D47|nr:MULTISPECIES: DUF2007 domain-containing protein [unclassified Olleya]AUC77072.1 hypothetical protein CW732_15860 [Olleya sp. Bg11-27]QXP59463.1 DUF2007 domain-containing protein [Olleya sp. HaHaR_3_96]